MPSLGDPRDLTPAHGSDLTRCLALAALGGVLHFLGFAGFGIWPLALVCLVPLWLAIRRCHGTIGAATAAGFVFGWVSYAGGYLWLWSIVDVFLGGEPLIAATFWAADSVWFATRYAAYGLLCGLAARHRRRFATVAPAALVVVEWLYPLLFPVHLGHAIAERRHLVQMADLGGPLLLTLFVAGTNAAALLAIEWLLGERRFPTRAWATICGCTLAALAYGTLRLHSIAEQTADAPTLLVGIVQGNLGLREKGAYPAKDHDAYLSQSRELIAEQPDLDLLVWPETVYSRGIRGPLPVSGALVAPELPVPLLFGAAYVEQRSGRRTAHNAALLVGTDGAIRHGYAKNLLIPFTEYVPLAEWLPALERRLPVTARFEAGSGLEPLELGAHRIATPICYEAVRPRLVRRMVEEGDAQLIVTLANDAWFGRSQGARLHLAMARIRSIELRRAMVRATNSGISAIVAPDGSFTARSGLLTRESVVGRVPLLRARSPYAALGDWPGFLSAALFLWGVLPTRHRPEQSSA